MTPTPFAAWTFENVDHPWLWLLLAVAGVLVLFLTYRGIFQRSERRLTWALMLLRGVGLLCLFLALAKPTWTRENEIVDPPRLAVVVDNSLSMSLPDPSGKSRYALAKDAVARLRKALEADRSGPRLTVELFDVNGAPISDLPEQPTVERTDLTRAVRDPVAKLRSKPLVGVVLVSDGMDNTGRQDFRELGNLPVPVYGVGFQPDPNASDLDFAVKPVKAPARVLVNNEIKVEVPVTKKGGAAANATLTIKRGRDTFATQKVAFGPGDGEQVVGLTIKPTEPGDFTFTAAVEAETGERLLANNAVHFPLHVDKERIRVLYVEGFLRYEYKFLKARLEEDPDVRLVPVVRQANPERSDAHPGKDLLTPEGLKNFDIVILGDLEGAYLSGPEYQALVKWLDEKGHALLVLGGYRSFGPDGFRTTPLADVLPVVFADRPPYQTEEPFVMQLTEEGRRHPVFEVSSDRVQDAAAWDNAPHLLGCSLVQRAKPGAEVLAVNPNFKVEDKPAVVAAIQRSGGGGHVMVLLADTTWRWSRLSRIVGQADTRHARFWSQTVRYLAGRGLDDRRPQLVVSTDRPAYEVGKQVTVTLRRQARPGDDLSAAEVGVEVTAAGGKSMPVPVQAGSADPDVFTGTFSPPAGGQYEVAASLKMQGKPVENQATEFRVYGSDLELADPGTNRENLKAMASATGGVYVDVQDAERLAEKMGRKEPRRITRVQRTEFWNSPWLFLAFVGAVTAEWLVRRRNHLV